MHTEKSKSSVAIKIIAAILIAAALTLGREFFIPIALAFAFHALLRPVVRLFEGWHLPSWVGAAVVVLSGLFLVVAGGWALSGPVGSFLERAPASIKKAREKVQTMGTPFQRIGQAAKGSSATPAAATPPAGGPPSAQNAPVAQPAVPRGLTSLLGTGSVIIGGLIEVLLLLYLLLAAGDLLFRKMVNVVPGRQEKRTMRDVLRDTESIVARYLIMTALINVGQAAAVGVAMWLIGMPEPWMWALLTFVLEFIPYLGGATNVALLLVTAFATFSTTGKILLPAILYLVITTIQNNVVSPYAYGGGLKLNPVAVMICVMLWWFVWGIPGVFLAVPIAATLKVLGDEVPSFAPLAELLGE
ncbi:MAG TPA: AI-2E family transporter [Gemmatimonadales bacterium]|nr:AI-2E family transporter [Gemmatimonadales bacterium]